MDFFQTPQFVFPYHYKFPGQASDEQILYLTRENTVVLWWRQFMTIALSIAVGLIGLFLARLTASLLGRDAANVVTLLFVSLAFLIGLIGWWWVTTLWRKSIAIVTTKRLTKFIYTSPFNRHNLSLPLEMIVDTGSYTKGYIQSIFDLGTLTARSSAASSGVATDDTERVNRKYFYIENIAKAEDLQHYITKLLSAFRTKSDQLSFFRPFIPYLKGEDRDRFMQQYPQYWSK